MIKYIRSLYSLLNELNMEKGKHSLNHITPKNFFDIRKPKRKLHKHIELRSTNFTIKAMRTEIQKRVEWLNMALTSGVKIRKNSVSYLAPIATYYQISMESSFR